MSEFLLGVPAKLKTLVDRLTSTRAGYLDRLQYVTSARMAQLDSISTALSQAVEYNTPGVHNYTVPAGVSLIWVTGIGGGGGGGGSFYNNSDSWGYGGGGGAAMALLRAPIAVTPGEVIAVTVGAGGAGGTAGASTTDGGPGANGGSTLIGAYLSAIGGFGGGGANYISSAGGLGGAGGTTHNPNARTNGGVDGNSIGYYVLGGDGSIGQASDTIPTIEAGACAAFGLGGFGAGGASFFGHGGLNGNALPGETGAGGGGGGANNRAGGAGGDGFAMIEWIGG